MWSLLHQPVAHIEFVLDRSHVARVICGTQNRDIESGSAIAHQLDEAPPDLVGAPAARFARPFTAARANSEERSSENESSRGSAARGLCLAASQRRLA